MSLENTHTGDTVILTTNFGRRRKVVTVDRETKTQLVAGGTKFRRQNGYPVGKRDRFDTASIRVPRDGEVEKVWYENRTRVLRYRIAKLGERRAVERLPLSSLERIFMVMEAEYANLENG
jgi:hypothetical protein